MFGYSLERAARMHNIRIASKSGCTRRDGFAPGAIGETCGPNGLAGAGRSLGA
jgi:hypothetical protein